MELYYHKTDGGAEYYCTDYIECDNGHKEGDVRSAVLRTDGLDTIGELEINLDGLKKALNDTGIVLKII